MTPRVPVSESAELERSYQPDLGCAAHWRELLTHREVEVRPLVLELATQFAERHSLTLLFPRHDVMDHVLPFRTPLGIADADEVLADLVKLATLNLLIGRSLEYPEAFLIESVVARKAENGYEYEGELPTLRRVAPQAWDSALRFYLAVGKEPTQRLWTTACRLHYEVRRLPFQDDYFSGRPFVFGDPDNANRCG